MAVYDSLSKFYFFKLISKMTTIVYMVVYSLSCMLWWNMLFIYFLGEKVDKCSSFALQTSRRNSLILTLIYGQHVISNSILFHMIMVLIGI